MSALLTQLEHMLTPWEAAENVKSTLPTHPIGGSVPATHAFQPPPPSAVGIPVSFLPVTAAHTSGDVTPSATTATTAVSATSLLDARQRTTKLELARAALAVFVSNAGEFRPVLQKTLAFLFQYLDFLLEERSRNVLELATARHLARSPAEGSGSGAGGAGADPSADGADDNAVASAHQRVRLVEAKMAALVEEASAQRDRYKAQIAAHEQQAARLEALLVHQMELTAMLLNDRHATGTGGATWDGASGVQGQMSAPGTTSGACRSVAKTEAQLRDVRDRVHANTSLWSDEMWAQRDPTYVRQLISRAEKEKLVADLEDQVSVLRKERNEVQSKLQDLLSLNARYARQAVELAARMSVIHGQNLALATDVQLFQRDTLREQQRADKLFRDVTVTRQMLLTLLEVRAQEVQSTPSPISVFRLCAPAATGTAPMPTLHPNTALLLHTAGAPAGLGAAESKALARLGRDNGPTVMPGVGSTSGTTPFSSAMTSTTPAALEDKDLRVQLEELLMATADVTINSVDAAASPRSVADQQQMQRALERVLVLRQETNRSVGHHKNTGTAEGDRAELRTVSTTAVTPSLLRLPMHLWVAPYGRHRHVPHHLRTTACTRLLPLHPLVAESYVQELLSHRMDLRLSLRRRYRYESEERAAAFLGPTNAARMLHKNQWTLLTGAGGSGASAMTTAGPHAAGNGPSYPALGMLGTVGERGPMDASLTPFDAYVCLFVRVLWLNEEDAFLPYLPDDVRQLYLLEKAPTANAALAALASASASSSASPRARRGLYQPREHRPAPPDNVGKAGSPVSTDPAPPPPRPTDKQRSCLTTPLSPAVPDSLYTLPTEALRLTYSLDVLSRSPESGFLTYAYGHASRRHLSELIFDVMQADRDVFLSMCREVDAQREMLKASRRAEIRRRIREERRQQRRAERAALHQQQAQDEAAAVAVAKATDAGTRQPTKSKSKKNKPVVTENAAGRAKSSKTAKAGATAKKAKSSSITATDPTDGTQKPPSSDESARRADDAAERDVSDDEDEEDDAVDGADTSQAVEGPPCSGCLPLVQLARVLTTMYPSYPLEKIEQLVVAAAAEGTDSTECPVLVYYGVLLPDRLLPGSAGTASGGQLHVATTTADKKNDPTTGRRMQTSSTSRAHPTATHPQASGATEGTGVSTSSLLWRCGSFASLFFNHICDDALESMMLVEDSLMSMAETLHTSSSSQSPQHAAPATQTSADASDAPRSSRSPRRKHISTATAGQTARSAHSTARSEGAVVEASSVPVESVEATEAQLTSLGFTGLPLAQMHAWSAALRSVLHGWQRLRATVRNEGEVTTRASLNGLENDTVPGTSPVNAQPASVPESHSTPSLSADATGRATATAEAASTMHLPRASVSEVIAYLRAHTLLRRGPHKLSPASAAAMSADLPFEVAEMVHQRENQSWHPTHVAYIHALQSRWNAMHDVVHAQSDLGQESELDPSQPVSAAASAAHVAAEVGSADASIFFAWLHRHDPRREAVWGDDVVTATSSILRPAEDVDDQEDESSSEIEALNVKASDASAHTGARPAMLSGTVRQRQEATGRTPTPPPEPRSTSLSPGKQPPSLL